MIAGMFGILMLVVFVAAQGAVVFGTAYVALRLLKISHWLAKACAMTLSYLAWVTFTIVGYGMLGGDGGLMDGFGFVLTLCFFAAISSFIYLLIWTYVSSNSKAAD